MPKKSNVTIHCNRDSRWKRTTTCLRSCVEIQIQLILSFVYLVNFSATFVEFESTYVPIVKTFNMQNCTIVYEFDCVLSKTISICIYRMGVIAGFFSLLFSLNYKIERAVMCDGVVTNLWYNIVVCKWNSVTIANWLIYLRQMIQRRSYNRWCRI